MAERRMFAKSIIDSDAFIDMPVTARLLYYDLAMRADDDGFVNSPKKIMRMIGASQDDLGILILKKFLIPFENGVVVIKHWYIHNYIRKDRYNPTKYQKEKEQLTLKDNGSYSILGDSNVECIQAVTQSETNGIPEVDERLTQVRLGKVSIDNKKEKYKKEKSNSVDKTNLDRIISDYTDNPNLIESIKSFIKLRKALKAPLTDRALELNLKKLDKFASNDEEKIAVIEQSIERGWKGLFALKSDEKHEDPKDNIDVSKYDFCKNLF